MRIGIFAVVDHYPSELPRTLDTFYGELLDQAEAADALGFDSFWVAEHHFHEYGVLPRPAIFLAAAAMRTRRIRLGSAVAVLPFDHPLRIAEDYAMVDVLSNGRLNLGVGSGYLSHEFAGFGIPLEEKRDRFDEALALINRLWRGEQVVHHGRHYHLDGVKINIEPVQKTAPIWVASLRKETIPFVAARGLPTLLIPYASTERWEEIPESAAAYRRAYINHGVPPSGGAMGFGLHTHCAPTMSQALAEADEPMSRYVRTRLYAQKRSLTQLAEQNLTAIGDPESILNIVDRYAAAGLTHMLALTSFGAFPHAQVLRSMELLAKYVLPRFAPASQL